jgi:hypothetical protein
MPAIEDSHDAYDTTTTSTTTDVDTYVDVENESAISDDIGGATLGRKLTNNEHTTIPKAGDVRINVKGAFIVEDNEEEPGTPPSEDFDFDTEGYQLDRRGIRLPNHKAVVSHIAVDVSLPFPSSS